MSPESMPDVFVSSGMSIPKLRDDGANWVDYLSKAWTAMGLRGLIRHVDGLAKEPEPYKEIAGIPMVDAKTPATDKQIEAKEKRLEEYAQKDYSVCHIILSSVSPCLASVVKDMKTGHEMWIVVQQDATSKSDMHKVDTRRRLQLSVCNETGDVAKHLTTLIGLHNELLGMGFG
jgi:gag-polypeptide of LTR copia-type